MRKKTAIIVIFLSIIVQLSYCQGLSLDNLLELRPKSISELDVAFNSLNYKLENVVKRGEINQLNYKNRTNEFDESITIHQYMGRDNFITYYFDSSKIESKILGQVKKRNAFIDKENITEDGNIIFVYRSNKYIYFFVKNEDISSISIYTVKDYDKYYNY